MTVMVALKCSVQYLFSIVAFCVVNAFFLSTERKRKYVFNMKKASPKGKRMSIATVQGHYTHKFAYTISHHNHYIPRHINDMYINSYFALK
jgi:hypothetical protein